MFLVTISGVLVDYVPTVADAVALVDYCRAAYGVSARWDVAL